MTNLIHVSGRTKGEIAREAGVSPSYLSRILSGDVGDISGSLQAAIARAIGCSIDAFHWQEQYEREIARLASERYNVRLFVASPGTRAHGSVPRPQTPTTNREKGTST